MNVATKIGALWSRLRGRKPVAAGAIQLAHCSGEDRIVRGLANADMDQAIEAARETLSVFWAWHKTRPDDPDCCALKVRYPTGGGAEYIWFIDILRTDDLVTGMVANEPERLPELKLWQPTVIDVDAIADWAFRQDDLYYGHFTTRVLAASHSGVAAKKRSLSETPLPADLVRH